MALLLLAATAAGAAAAPTLPFSAPAERLADLLQGTPEHIAPAVAFEVKGRQHRALARDGKVDSVHPRTVNMAFRAFAKDFDVQLEMNRDLFAPNYQVIYQGLSDKERRAYPRAIDPLNHCFYRGRVAGDPHGYAAISTCRGIKGIVVAHGEILAVEPTWLHGLAEVDGKDHIVFRVEDAWPQEFMRRSDGEAGESFCGVEHDDMHDFVTPDMLQSSASAHEAGRQIDRTDKIVEYMVVNDQRRFNLVGEDVETNTAEYVNIVNELYLNADFEPRILFVFTVQIIWAQGDPIVPNPAGGNEINTSDLLDKFNTWAWNPENAPDHDNHALFSGYDFGGSTVGLAGVCSMCTGTRSGNVNQITSRNQAFGAAILAHEAGHNFCMRHDSDGNSCPASGLIMNAVLTSTAPSEFSSCSAVYLEGFYTGAGEQFSNGYYNQPSRQCLENTPTRTAGDAVCGDGFVSGDEQCDCFPNCDESPCCDGETCLFTEGSVCDDSEPCCDGCQYVPATAEVECRPAIGSCDYPEYCRGFSSECPSNIFRAAGIECVDDRQFPGVCFEGTCQSHDQVCEDKGGDDFPDNQNCPQAPCNGDILCRQASSNRCFTLTGRTVEDGVPCTDPDGSTEPHQCLNNACVASSDPSLNPKWVRIRAPLLDDNLKANSDFTIQVDSAASVATLDLQIADWDPADGAGEFSRIASNVASPEESTEYLWRTPKGDAEKQYIIRAVDADDSSITSLSTPFLVTKKGGGNGNGDGSGGGGSSGSGDAAVIGGAVVGAGLVIGLGAFGAMRAKKGGGLSMSFPKPSFSFARGGGSAKLPLTSNVSSAPVSRPVAPAAPAAGAAVATGAGVAAMGASRAGVANKPLPAPPRGKPLPAPPGGGRSNWETVYTDDGTPYYFNKQTQQTSWDRPAGM